MRPTIPKSVREAVYSRYDYKCGYCGCEPEKLVVDHIKPFQAGGSSEIINLMPACSPCNNFKTSYGVNLFRQELESQVSKARKYSVNFRLAERYGLIQVTEKPIKFYFEIQEGL